MTSFRLTEQQLTKSIVSYDEQVTGKIRKNKKQKIICKPPVFFPFSPFEISSLH